MKFANEKCDPNIPKILIGNKCDEPHRIITDEMAVNFAKNLDLYYVNTSAKNNTNVWDAIIHLATDILNNRDNQYYQNNQDNQNNENENIEGGSGSTISIVDDDDIIMIIT